MKIDITLKVTPEMVHTAQGNEKKAFTGHLGTHFDVMNKEFPLEYTKRQGVIFDVSKIKGRDIELKDIDINKVKKDMFVCFYSGFIENVKYGTQEYFKNHPQLSKELIDVLLAKDISIIGIDFAGLRRGKEHVEIDQRCADKNTFVVENLCNLYSIIKTKDTFVANTYPMNFANMSGLPCRVVAEI